MSEVQSRPPPTRGRSSARGGRGGSRGGGRAGYRQSNGDHTTTTKEEQELDMIADQGEIGEMKKQWGSELGALKELFPDWTDVDLLLALQETNGDLERTVVHITEGNVSQFSDVKKKTKDRARSKVKDSSAAAADP
ncbi:hypothetical protein LTS18_013763, partial [Coniosporium uncinatum]